MRLEKYLTEKEKISAVQLNGFAIRYIKNPSEEVQLEAAKKNNIAIQFIDNPSEEVQLAAVKQGACIQYIDNLSKKVIRYILANYSSDEDTMQLLFAKIGKEGYDKLSDNDKLKLELLG